MHFHSAFFTFELQNHDVVEQFVTENIPLVSERVVDHFSF